MIFSHSGGDSGLNSGKCVAGVLPVHGLPVYYACAEPDSEECREVYTTQA